VALSGKFGAADLVLARAQFPVKDQKRGFPQKSFEKRLAEKTMPNLKAKFFALV